MAAAEGDLWGSGNASSPGQLVERQGRGDGRWGVSDGNYVGIRWLYIYIHTFIYMCIYIYIYTYIWEVYGNIYLYGNII